jgi:hypothetical protein
VETDWILDEIATGLQKLYLLSLDRTPAAELLAGTAQSWLEIITTGRVWDEARDAHRIREAFVTLGLTRESWPAPKHFIEALPPVRVGLMPIEKEFRPASPAVVAKARAELERFVAAPAPLTEDAAKAESKRLAEVEAALRQHYGRDGKTAACGPDA